MKKTLTERERELQGLMRTDEGRAELEVLASRYAAAGGEPRAHRGSLVTYILVYERVAGLLRA